MSASMAARMHLVVGGGRSGHGAARLLRAAGERVRWVDERERPDGALADEVFVGPWSPAWLDDVTEVVWSPGIPLTHPLAEAARERGIPVVAEIEVAWRYCAAPVVAVTGSNGKTTVTAWIAHLMRAGGKKAIACGNIGLAFSEVVADQLEGGEGADVWVVEVSSFQLESIQTFRPKVGLVLNVTPDHLDRYGAMEGYAAAKERLALCMGEGDALILNNDDAFCRAMGERATCERVSFGEGRRSADRGAWLEGGAMIWREKGAGDLIWCGQGDLFLPGRHNVMNGLAAAAAATRMGVPAEAVAEGLRDFRGVSHRIEWVRSLDGVDYYNDSKSTNVQSLEAALASFEVPVVLIAGGRDKKGPFGDIGELVRERVAQVILIGEASDVIAEAWRGVVPVRRAGDMGAAINQARDLAESGQVVLLSPACASFDMYRNFEERGDDFKSRVLALKEKNG